MVVLTAETCWVINEYWINNKISGIKLVFPFTQRICILHVYFKASSLPLFMELNVLNTSRKIVGSIPNGVNKIFHILNPSYPTVTLRSPRLLTKIRTREDNRWPAGAYGWQPYHLHGPTVYKFWQAKSPGALREFCKLAKDKKRKM